MVAQLPPDQERVYMQDCHGEFLAALGDTPHLRCELGEDWLAGLEKLINRYSGKGTFSAPDHPLFIAFLHDRTAGKQHDAVRRLERNFAFLVEATNKKAKVRSKLRGAGSPVDKYLSDIFEFDVLGPIAHAGYLDDYEPKVGCTQRNVEARLKINGQVIFIECAFRMENNDLGFDPLLRKIAEKAFDPSAPPKVECQFNTPGQLALCDAPTLLVLGGHVGDDLYDPLLDRIAKDCGFATVSAIGRASQNVERVRVWHNPLARRPLPRSLGFTVEACFEPGRQRWLWRQWMKFRAWLPLWQKMPP